MCFDQHLYIHVHLHSWLGLMTSEPKGLTKKSSQGENLFPCNKFISSWIVMCIGYDLIYIVLLDWYASKLKGEIIIQYTSSGESLINSMQKCKSIVPMVYQCYFFNQLLHCIGMACIIMWNDDVNFTRSKRVNKDYTSSRKTSFHAKFQAQCLHGFPVLT